MLVLNAKLLAKSFKFELFGVLIRNKFSNFSLQLLSKGELVNNHSRVHLLVSDDLQ